MRKYRLLSMSIIAMCSLIALVGIITIYEQMQNVADAQKSLNDYKERMSAPVDALEPNTFSRAGSINGEMIIPKLQVDCQIRSDTVNAYDAVYHYPQSAAFGQPGEAGILGHRTTYSGLFRNIGDLVPGDQVIIQDSLLKKKYVYEVTSNGDDIRWDYQSNPVRFAMEGEPRLLLITCYPPGQKEAAYIVHCKLVSKGNL